jgi:hypothetical protein
MNICGFGDSFMDLPRDNNVKNLTYLKQVADKFNATFEPYGEPGTGPWSAFFNFQKYKNKENIDVAIFAWSEHNRLYHPIVRPINFTSVHNPKVHSMYPKEIDYDVWEAAKQYYRYIYDDTKSKYEAIGLYHLMDHLSLDYPHIKFIHMFCYALHNSDQIYLDIYNDPDVPNNLKYPYLFKNGVNIRPALMYMSYLDEWPDDLYYETRDCHLSQKMHNVLTETLYTAITNANIGDIVNVNI